MVAQSDLRNPESNNMPNALESSLNHSPNVPTTTSAPSTSLQGGKQTVAHLLNKKRATGQKSSLKKNADKSKHIGKHQTQVGKKVSFSVPNKYVTVAQSKSSTSNSLSNPSTRYTNVTSSLGNTRFITAGPSSTTVSQGALSIQPNATQNTIPTTPSSQNDGGTINQSTRLGNVFVQKRRIKVIRAGKQIDASTPPNTELKTAPQVAFRIGPDSSGNRVAYLDKNAKKKSSSNVVDLTDNEQSKKDKEARTQNKGRTTSLLTQHTSDKQPVKIAPKNLAYVDTRPGGVMGPIPITSTQTDKRPLPTKQGIETPTLTISRNESIKRLVSRELQFCFKNKKHYSGVVHTFCTLTGIHKKYLCNVCRYVSEDVKSFVEHFKKEHTFKCHYCNKIALSRIENLKHGVTCRPGNERTGVEVIDWDGTDVR